MLTGSETRNDAAPSRSSSARRRSIRAVITLVREKHKRVAVAIGSLADDALGDDVLDDRVAPPLLALLDIREVYLDDGHPEQLEGVPDRVAVVRPRSRVDDDGVGPVARVVAPLDVLAFVVRLEAADAALELARPLVDLRLELGEAEPAVDRRVAIGEHVEVDAVDH